MENLSKKESLFDITKTGKWSIVGVVALFMLILVGFVCAPEKAQAEVIEASPVKIVKAAPPKLENIVETITLPPQELITLLEIERPNSDGGVVKFTSEAVTSAVAQLYSDNDCTVIMGKPVGIRAKTFASIVGKTDCTVIWVDQIVKSADLRPPV